MKTKLITFVLFLLPCLLSAQFFFRLDLDDTGLYSVIMRTEEVILDPIAGSGQVTITAPLGGFEVGEVTSVNGTWNGSVDIVDQSISADIPHDYFFIGLRDGDGINGLDICEEQTLFTFRNIGVNTGRAALITDEDPIITKEIDLNNNPNHDLSVFDSSTGKIHNVEGVYQEAIITTYTELTETICEGESFLFNEMELTEPGTYIDSTQNSNGCYNYTILTLRINANGDVSQRIVLQPDKANGKDASIRGYWPDRNFHDGIKFYVYTWTHSGNRGPGRALIDFDLTQIPSNAMITNASLSLYSSGGTDLDLADHSTRSGSNASYIERITAPWEESTVTWDTQPTTTTTNRVSLPATTSVDQDFLNMDVTQLVGDMVADSSNNHGFMMRLQTEVEYRNLSFYTSDYTDALKRPKLEITYTVPSITRDSIFATICQGEGYEFNGTILTETGIYQDSLTNSNDCGEGNVLNLTVKDAAYTELEEVICQGENYEWNGVVLTTSGTYQDTLQNSNGCDSILVLNLTVHSDSFTQIIVLQPDSTKGKDASIRSLWPTRNFDNFVKFYVSAWTHSGTPMKGRALIDFDLTQIPSNALITNASLSLYSSGGADLDLGDHSTRSGSNASYIERITSPWEESEVTYDTQPTTTTTNRVSLPATTSSNQDFLDIDVTALVEDMIADSENSHGFRMRLQTESFYRNLGFYTSDYVDAAKHPKLEITYIVPNETILRDTICQGENYDFNGTILTESGIYMDTLQNSNGCNNIRTLELIVLDSSSSICDTTETPIDTVANLVMTNIQRRGNNCLYVEWSPIEEVVGYQLEVRLKGMDNWEDIEILKTDAAKAYIYGPIREGLECRIKMNYPNDEQIISDVFDLSEPLED